MNKEDANIKDIIFLKPHFEPKVWGSNYFAQRFNNQNLKTIGEAWLISAMKKRSSKIINKNNYDFNQYVRENKAIFNLKEDECFPLLVKILAPKKDLSVQVHPNNQYAKLHENATGKTEAWYILDALEGTFPKDIVLGLKTIDINILSKSIKNNKWDDILKIQPVKLNSSININSGIVHALTKNIIALEIQQASDVTYRLFDYNRLDNGQLREKHIDKSLNVISDENLRISTEFNQNNLIHNNAFFTTKLHANFRTISFKCFPKNKLFFVESGQGNIFLNNNKITLSQNDIFIIPFSSQYEFKIESINELKVFEITNN